METFERIKKELQKKVKNKKITEESSFKNLGIDSIDLLDFVVNLEKELKIEISDQELMEIEKVSDVVKLINSKK